MAEKLLVPVLALALAASGCLAHERDSDAGASATDSCVTRTLGPPMRHRATAEPCPAQRGPIADTPACDVATDSTCPMARCVTDADCTDGVNGRCSHLHRGNADIRLFCTYDECATDGDCMSGPCRCRPDATSNIANECFDTGNCRVDSDCGPGGFCSPSLVDMGFCACPTEDLCVDAGNGTGCFVSYDGGPPMAVNCLCGNTCAAPGWYCHTPCDECTNDSDCTGRGDCLFDQRRQIWACTFVVCTSGP